MQKNNVKKRRANNCVEPEKDRKNSIFLWCSLTANKFGFHATHIYTNTWSFHIQEHTVFFVFIRMFYFVVVVSIELLVPKENYNK